MPSFRGGRVAYHYGHCARELEKHKSPSCFCPGLARADPTRNSTLGSTNVRARPTSLRRDFEALLRPGERVGADDY
jgi:hypothetical protein